MTFPVRISPTIFLFSVLSVMPAMAQQAANAIPLAVELAVPFGTVPGKLLLLGNHIVFLDEQQLESSVVMPKSTIERLTAEGGTVAIVMKEPVRARSAELRTLNFRVATGGDPAAVTAWFASGAGSMAGTGPGSAPSTASAQTGTYQARHNHRIGDCKGRLVLEANQLAYESVDDVSHSRRWEYKSIKETSLSNPYELEIKPFAGGNYKLYLDGSGMDPAAYKTLVDRVVAARSQR